MAQKDFRLLHGECKFSSLIPFSLCLFRSQMISASDGLAWSGNQCIQRGAQHGEGGDGDSRALCLWWSSYDVGPHQTSDLRIDRGVCLSGCAPKYVVGLARDGCWATRRIYQVCPLPGRMLGIRQRAHRSCSFLARPSGQASQSLGC